MLYAKALWAGPEPSRTMPRQETDSSQASVLPLASPYNRTHPNRDIPIIVRCGNEEAGQVRSSPRSTNLSMQIGKKRQAPMRRWRPNAQETFVEFASARLDLLLGWPIDFKLTDSASHHLQQLLILQGLGRLIDWSSVEPAPQEEAAFFPLRALPERALDLEAVDGDRDLPVSISCSRSNCEPHECRRRSALAATGPEPRGSLVKIPSTNKDFRERSVRSGKRSQWGQSAPSLNAAAACPAPKQATHCSCVSPAVMKRLQGDTHGLHLHLVIWQTLLSNWA